MVILSLTIMLSGCAEEQQAATAAEKKGKIVLESDVVELAGSSFTKNKKVVTDDVTGERYEVVRDVEVGFRFRNIANKDIRIKVDCEFYDENGDLVGIKQVAREITLPKGYTERATNTLTNKAVYDGKRKSEIVKAVIVAEEI